MPVRAPSFLSGGLPRDRRGRVAHKHRSKPSALNLVLTDEDDAFGDETPRLGQSHDAEHRRRLELLDSLKYVAFICQGISVVDGFTEAQI